MAAATGKWTCGLQHAAFAGAAVAMAVGAAWAITNNACAGQTAVSKAVVEEMRASLQNLNAVVQDGKNARLSFQKDIDLRQREDENFRAATKVSIENIERAIGRIERAVTPDKGSRGPDGPSKP